MDIIFAMLGALGAVAGIVQTIVVLLERSERRRLERTGRSLSGYEPVSPPWRPPLRSEKPAQPTHIATPIGWLPGPPYPEPPHVEPNRPRREAVGQERPIAQVPPTQSDGPAPGPQARPPAPSLDRPALPEERRARFVQKEAVPQPPPMQSGDQVRNWHQQHLPSPANSLDPDNFAVAWRASLSYLLGFVGALIFRKDTRQEVRFHAVQSLWIDILAVIYFFTALTLLVIYVILRYPDPEAEIPANDPVMWVWVLTVMLGAPLAHLTLSIAAIMGRHPRIPLVWRIAATVTVRQEEQRSYRATHLRVRNEPKDDYGPRQQASHSAQSPTGPRVPEGQRFEKVKHDAAASTVPQRQPASPHHLAPRIRKSADEYRFFLAHQPAPIDPDKFAIAWRSSIAYLFGAVGALMFWRSPRREVRFHAVQSLWIDILAITYFFVAFVLTLIYTLIRYSQAGSTIPADDPILSILIYSTTFGPPITHLAFAIISITGRHPRLPLIWRIAATVNARQEERRGVAREGRTMNQ
jgi:uncharacterized membrane protein